jgi:ParB-like chromosome segregation protein Spo0J
MNSTHMMINPNELVIDMPVDEGNVKLEMESLQSSGMVQPVTVWLQDLRIIDGFHRTEAAKRLGWSEISCNVIDCTEDAFWDARIQSAKQHHAIEAQRLEAWMLESWKATEWAEQDIAPVIWESICLAIDYTRRRGCNPAHHLRLSGRG